MFQTILAAYKMVKRAYSPFYEYTGSESQVTNKIITRCFNGKFFQVSLGHFPQFYMRDFGMCVKSLCALGYTKECVASVLYALDGYMRENRVSTTIDQNDKCVDFFAYGPDSLAFLLHSIRVTKFRLTKPQKLFLLEQAKRCFKLVWDESYGGVKTHTYFSSSKDHYKRNASCYDFCMIGWISKNLDELEIENPWGTFNFREQLLTLYWSGDAFYDDLDKEEFSGDAQTFPFYCFILDVKKDKSYMESAVKKVKELKLDSPFPLKYTAKRNKKKELFLPSLFAPNYEGDTVWIHTGLCYMEVIAQYDKKLLARYLSAYAKNISRHKNFLEVYTKDGLPYRSLLYKSDESMLWISMYYALTQ